jgi:hypothetical protein
MTELTKTRGIVHFLFRFVSQSFQSMFPLANFRNWRFVASSQLFAFELFDPWHSEFAIEPIGRHFRC